MGWCDDPRSKKYNKLITLPFDYHYEKLFKTENTYDIVLVLNYNMAPIKKDKGSAIFIHVSKRNYKSTAGCVAIKKIELLKLLKNIKKNTKVEII
jgi:L,D-peptidoglycan transpeptidase YkuD (ErfK/YbiS/YcfS/YnhG family)